MITKTKLTLALFLCIHFMYSQSQKPNIDVQKLIADTAFFEGCTTQKIKYVECYGATGNPDDNDRDAIQAALDDGDGIVVLMAQHNLGDGFYARLINRKNNIITYFGSGKSELIGTNTHLIINQANLKISNIKVLGKGTTNGFLYLEPKHDYDILEVTNCEFNDLEYGAIYARGGTANAGCEINKVTIKNNTFSNSSVALLSYVKGDSFTFSNNIVNSFRGHVFIAQYNNGTSRVNNIYFQNNRIVGVQKSTIDNIVFQALTKESIHIKNNYIKDVYGDEVFLVYTSQGNLFFSENHCENIKSNNQYLIYDKGSAAVVMHINDNTFDQRLVSLMPDEPNNAGIINIANNSNSLVTNNVFINLKSTAVVLGNSSYQNDSSFPRGCIISNNQFKDIENYSCIYIQQIAKDISIKNNVVFGLSNPLDRKGNKESDARFLSIINTKSNGSIDNIIVSDNSVFGLEKEGTLVWSYKYNGGGIDKLKLWRNTIDSGEALVKYRNHATDDIELLFNVLPTGTPLAIEGTAPLNSRISQNIN